MRAAFPLAGTAAVKALINYNKKCRAFLVSRTGRHGFAFQWCCASSPLSAQYNFTAIPWHPCRRVSSSAASPRLLILRLLPVLISIFNYRRNGKNVKQKLLFYKVFLTTGSLPLVYGAQNMGPTFIITFKINELQLWDDMVSATTYGV